MHIRKAERAEIPIVAELARVIWPECFTIFLTPEQIEVMLDSIYAPESLAAEMEQGHVFWVASIDGRDVGFASAYVEGSRLWLKKLYILPDTQGSGVGKALINTAIAHFSDATEIALYVNQHNAPAIACYEHTGFAIREKTPVKMGPFDFIDCVMIKNIAN